MYRLKNLAEKIKFLREASDVQRLHTKRTIGEYSNGSHTFGMLVLLRLIYPDAPLHLIWAIIEHDIPERLVGDIPSPAIHFGGFVDKEKLDKTEESILDGIFDSGNYFSSLRVNDPESYRWLKGLDLLELFLFCKDQKRLGSKNLFQIEHRCMEIFKSRAADFPRPIIDAFWECWNDTDWFSLPDLGVAR
jgi:5'-deoxynucleotidase YfbR-like HD superfamily hydrolase